MLRRIFCKLLLVAVVVLSLLALCGPLMAQGRRDEAFARVLEVQRIHTARLMAIKGVEGTAVGLNQNDQPALHIYTAKPGVAGIPNALDGVPIRVVVTGEFFALPKPTDKPGKPGGGGGGGKGPKAPTGLTATAVSSSQIDLDWNDNKGRDVQYYRVYRFIPPDYELISVDGEVVSSEYLDEGLDASTEYNYFVTAVDKDGKQSNPSNEASATTWDGGGDPQPPAKPENLDATAVSSSQINLSWTDNSNNEDGFEIERDGSVIDTVGAGVTSYSDTGLASSTLYTYRVRAYNVTGNSAYSNFASDTTDSEPVAPSAPSNLSATAVSSSQINLSWTDNSNNEDGFEIERDGSVIDTVGAGVTSYSDTGLAPSTPYTYRVRAYNGVGNSAYSNTASDTTDSEPVEHPPLWWERPVPIGVSTGHPSITAGTLGCRVVDSEGNVYALSNNHVYAASNEASIGDAVIQPGTYDGGTSPADNIGTLAAFQEVMFDGSDNTIDAAIASTTTGQVGNATPAGSYDVPASTPYPTGENYINLLNLAVQKHGRTTGRTYGGVFSVMATLNVNYGTAEEPKIAKFVEQILIVEAYMGYFSQGGDSGSLIVSYPEKQPVGLLFAGGYLSSFIPVTVANPIDQVLDHFNVTVDGQ